ncbi:MAG: PAS domain S-box protein, partial [Planctomycetota bacterium]
MNLTRRLFVPTICFVTLLVSGLCLALWAITLGDHRRHEKSNGEVAARFLASRAQSFLLENDPAGLESLIEDVVAQHPTIEYVLVEQRGAPCVHTFSSGVPEGLLELRRELPDAASVNEFHDPEGRVFYDVAAVVRAADAVVHVGLSQEAVDGRVAGLFWVFWGIGLGALAVGAALAAIGLVRVGRAVGSDVSESGRAKSALEQERYLLHALMDNLPHNIYFKDIESRFIRINKALANCFGLSDAAEALGKTDFDYFTKEHAQQALDDEREILHTKRPIIDKEERETWQDGHTTWAATTKMPMYDDQGRVVGTFGVSRDVTEHKESEEALRTSEMRYRTLFDSSRDAIMVCSPVEGFVSGNAAAVKLFGCRDEAEFTSCTPADLSPDLQPDGISSTEKAQQIMATAMAKGSHFFEWKHKRIDGSEFFATVLLTRMELEGERLLQATVRDVSEEKRAAEALRTSEMKFRTLFDSSRDAIMVLTADEGFLSGNPAAVKLFGCRDEEEFTSCTPADLSPDLQ